VEQVEHGAGVEVSETNDLARKERLPRSCVMTQYAAMHRNAPRVTHASVPYNN